MKVYKVVVGDNGFKEFELKVTKMVNQGWECIGGISFNHGFAHQAMMKEVEKKEETATDDKYEKYKKPIVSADRAMAVVDELT